MSNDELRAYLAETIRKSQVGSSRRIWAMGQLALLDTNKKTDKTDRTNELQANARGKR